MGQMQDLRYGTHNTLLNLGTIFFFFAFYCIKVVIFILCSIIKFLSDGYFKFAFLKKLQKQLFFSEIISICLEAYFKLVISGTLSYHANLTNTDGEIVGNIAGKICLVTAFIIIPGMLYYVMTLHL